MLADLVAERSGMPFADYLRTESSSRWAWLTPGSIPVRPGPAAAGLAGPLTDLLSLGRELAAPTLVSAGHPPGRHLGPVRGPGRGAPRLPALRSLRLGPGRGDPRAQAAALDRVTNSPATFGHFGRSGSFLWVDPVAGVLCAGLTDRPFGPWAARAWPALADAVLGRVRRSPGPREAVAGAPRLPPDRCVVPVRLRRMKGVILAGGTGSRLHPLTRITNKHLLPIYDRPMINWGIEALVNAGITEIMLVTGGTHAGEFLRLLGNGHEFGIDRLSYGYQEKPGGIAEALGLAARFVDGDPVLVMLADNIVERSIKPMVDAFRAQPTGARILLTPVEEDEHLRHLGVPDFDDAATGDRHRGEAGAPGVEVRRHRDLLLRLRCLRRDPDPGALGSGRARDHRRQQPLHLPGHHGLRRPRGVLGRRRRVDRRLLHGQRLRPRPTAPTRADRHPAVLGLGTPAVTPRSRPAHSTVSARWRA